MNEAKWIDSGGGAIFSVEMFAIMGLVTSKAQLLQHHLAVTYEPGRLLHRDALAVLRGFSYASVYALFLLDAVDAVDIQDLFNA